MARWTASAKWAEGPALDGQRDMPLALRLSEGLGVSRHAAMLMHLKGAFSSSPALACEAQLPELMGRSLFRNKSTKT